ncbi:phage tail terminator-like protein [Metapseudomonas otitidis]|uniref:phage tail terminator-like protein n=1 Tax=Metapseudomonas otitidis TaxID=319939 RepID=UPI001CA44FD0|nr:phage tail terminator-like protein [Pseudomonas otitidis]QZX85351.1 DUF4128 domain-containing protein [Pseudomonas otitidis]
MSHARARRAIEAILADWAEAWPIDVAFGTQPFEPPADRIYLRAYLLPATTASRYLGGEAYEYTGVYQVSIVVPIGRPAIDHEVLVDELATLFPVDLDLSESGFEGVVLTPVHPGPCIVESTTYTVPTSFTYQGEADK